MTEWCSDESHIKPKHVLLVNPPSLEGEITRLQNLGYDKRSIEDVLAEHVSERFLMDRLEPSSPWLGVKDPLQEEMNDYVVDDMCDRLYEGGLSSIRFEYGFTKLRYGPMNTLVIEVS